MTKTYTHTREYKEHKFQVTFGNGACGECPFTVFHPIHIKYSNEPVVYKEVKS